ncbi:ATP-dependent DNA helicase RecG [Longispora albida]|uniref:ATP-dependent DNA helicase RecG n=1 Tax=Longispora albida TaxID=203523 RepID=UPI000379ABD0|nr:ATP-dependent DNA helicase RecG [Longispora albida]
MATLDTPLKGIVGGTTAGKLDKGLDLHTVGDLLRHYPRRYDERGEHTDLAALEIGDEVTLMAQVQRVTAKQMKQRRGSILEVVIGDGIRTITATFFNQPWRERELKVGKWGLFAGKVTEFREKRQLNGPEYVLLDPEGDAASEIEEFAGAIIPVYPAAAGLPTWVISKCVRLALEHLETPPDPLPQRMRAERKLAGLETALRDIHRPPAKEALYAARKRLKWDEAFALQVTLVQRKLRAAGWPAVPRPGRPDGLLAAFDKSLPFELTEGQVQVGAEISADLATAHPMHRLLQGDVGAGKTLVALRAILQAADSGAQAALLAPTEVLAAQHHRGIIELLGPLGADGDAGLLAGDATLGVELLTGSLGAAARRRVLARLASGESGLVVGTHALLSEGVDFHDLGLVVVDEQHRFGVEQRDVLRAKASQPPHTLVMTATPIPRTVAMTVYGDLEVSALTQLPAGRSPIATHVVPATDERWLNRSWQRLREEVGKGHQAYVVCPRIGDEPSSGAGDKRPPLAVLDIGPFLASGPLHGLRVGILHGRMAPEDKDAVMRSFAAGDTDVLVATTVIEVGVNVPNATMMVILDAERFGVSQLHQLRGRVGRGTAPGLCLLVSEAMPGSPSHERLTAVASTTDGFRLAELDLEQRREGDVLGAAQSGKRSAVRLLSVIKDADLITEARAAAAELVSEDVDLAGYPALAATVATLVGEERAEFLEKG